MPNTRTLVDVERSARDAWFNARPANAMQQLRDAGYADNARRDFLARVIGLDAELIADYADMSIADVDECVACDRPSTTTITDDGDEYPVCDEHNLVQDTNDHGPGCDGPLNCTCSDDLIADGSLDDLAPEQFTDTCPDHGTQMIVDQSSTGGADPYAVAVLACGHGVACFGPGEDNVIVRTDRRRVQSFDVDQLPTDTHRRVYHEARRQDIDHDGALQIAMAI